MCLPRFCCSPGVLHYLALTDMYAYIHLKETFSACRSKRMAKARPPQGMQSQKLTVRSWLSYIALSTGWRDIGCAQDLSNPINLRLAFTMRKLSERFMCMRPYVGRKHRSRCNFIKNSRRLWILHVIFTPDIKLNHGFAG